MVSLPTLSLCLGISFQWCDLAVFFQKALEGGLEGAFVRDAVVAVALQGGVIFLEGLMSRLDTR